MTNFDKAIKEWEAGKVCIDRRNNLEAALTITGLMLCSEPAGLSLTGIARYFMDSSAGSKADLEGLEDYPTSEGWWEALSESGNISRN